MTSTIQDAIRDEIADIRFSRRKLALSPEKIPHSEWTEELIYHDKCNARVKRLFATRHTAQHNKYGYFE